MLKLPTATAFVLAAGMAQADSWVVKTSPHDVVQTADRLANIIEASPATLVARIDHQAAAQKAGLEMTPATVLIFGNPKIGTPIMQAQPMAAIDLPLRVLIWQDEGSETRIGYLAPEALAKRYEIDGAADAFAAMTKALDGMTEKAIAQE